MIIIMQAHARISVLLLLLASRAAVAQLDGGLEVELCTSLSMRGGQVRMPVAAAPNGAAARTVTAWIKPDCRTATELLRGLHNVVSWGHSGFAAERFSLKHAGGCARSQFAGGGDVAWSGLAGPSDGWTHIALTYEGVLDEDGEPTLEGNMFFHVDGERTDGPQPIGALATWVVDENHPIVVGGDTYPGTGEPFLGLIKRVRVWDRALSAEEVAADFADVGISILDLTVTVAVGETVILLHPLSF